MTTRACKKIIILFYPIVFVVLFPLAETSAFHIELEPRFIWQIYYDDNVAGIQEEVEEIDKITDFSNIYRPELKFKIAFHRLEITGLTKATVYRYFDEKEWDNTDKNYNINTLLKLNPRSEINFFSSYIISTNPERYFTGEAGYQGGILVRRTRDEAKNFGSAYLHRLSKKTQISFLFFYTAYKAEQNTESDIYIYALSFDHILNKKNKVRFSMGYNNLDFSYPGEGNFDFSMDTYTVTVGFDHEFKKDFTLAISVGWNYTETDLKRAVFEEDPATGEQIFVGTEPDTTSTTGSNFTFELAKQFYHTSLSLSASQTLGTNPDTGETYPTIRVGLNIGHSITEKLKASVGFYYYRNETNAGDYNNRLDITRDSYLGTISLRYTYNRNMAIQLGYSNITTENDFENRTSETKRNTVTLQFDFFLKRPFIVM